MHKPRVMIALPSYGQVDTQFAVQLSHIVLEAQAAGIETPVHTVLGSVIHKSRNILVRQARERECTHLWFLDTDMILPDGTLPSLLAHDKDVVGCVYRKRARPHQLVGQQLRHDDNSGFRAMSRMPTGCLLIRMSVFDKIADPWFEFVAETEGEDYNFSRKAVEAGFELWADIPLSMDVGHLATTVIWTGDDYGNEGEGVVQEARDNRNGASALEVGRENDARVLDARDPNGQGPRPDAV